MYSIDDISQNIFNMAVGLLVASVNIFVILVDILARISINWH